MLPVLACAVAVAGCLVAEHRSSQGGLWLAKPLASAAFVWAALAWGALASSFGSWILAGLAACALGDVLLISKRTPEALRAGMVAFGIGHTLFAIAFIGQGLAPAATLAAGGVVLAMGLWVWRWLRPQLERTERRSVPPYLFVIGAMLCCAFGAAAGGAAGPATAGALLFAVSDLAVAQDRFVAPSFASTLWGLPAYYTAQLLLAAGAAAP